MYYNTNTHTHTRSLLTVLYCDVGVCELTSNRRWVGVVLWLSRLILAWKKSFSLQEAESSLTVCVSFSLPRLMYSTAASKVLRQ